MTPARTSGDQASPVWRGAAQRAACLISGDVPPWPWACCKSRARTAQQHWWGQRGSAPCPAAAPLHWHECPGLKLGWNPGWVQGPRLFKAFAWQLLNHPRICSRARALEFLEFNTSFINSAAIHSFITWGKKNIRKILYLPLSPGK